MHLLPKADIMWLLFLALTADPSESLVSIQANPRLRTTAPGNSPRLDDQQVADLLTMLVKYAKENKERQRTLDLRISNCENCIAEMLRQLEQQGVSLNSLKQEFQRSSSTLWQRVQALEDSEPESARSDIEDIKVVLLMIIRELQERQHPEQSTKKVELPQFGYQRRLGVEVVSCGEHIKVKRVYPGEAAETLGLQVGDCIASVNGRSISSADEVLVSLADSKTVELHVGRHGKQLHLSGQFPR